MRTLVDSNVLIARIAPERVEHQTAIDSVSRLLASTEELFVTPQNIAEFWRVATTPRRRPGGLGLTDVEAGLRRKNIKAILRYCATSRRCMTPGNVSSTSTR